jgi:hypothetical protein
MHSYATYANLYIAAGTIFTRFEDKEPALTCVKYGVHNHVYSLSLRCVELQPSSFP